MHYTLSNELQAQGLNKRSFGDIKQSITPAAKDYLSAQNPQTPPNNGKQSDAAPGIITLTLPAQVHSSQKKDQNRSLSLLKVPKNVTRVSRITSGRNEAGSKVQRETAYFGKVSHTSVLNNQNGAPAPRVSSSASNYYTAEEIIILCSISVNPEQNVLVNS